MSIRTWAVNCNDAWLNTEGDDISDSYVKYKDHQDVVAELEAKCAALAAENAAMKESDVPLGAIENGRAFADRLEAYPFECEGGNLNMCSDWQELRRCFEHLSEWAMHSRSETPATDALLSEVRAISLEDFADVMADSGHYDAANYATKQAHKIRQEAAQ